MCFSKTAKYCFWGEEFVLEDNSMDKLMSMLNNGNIPEEMKSIISNMNSSNKEASSSSTNNNISPEAINKLMSMLNSKSNSNNGVSGTSNPTDNSKSGVSNYTNNSSESSSQSGNESNNIGIDFETIMKFKTIMDKMNSKDDPRSRLLTSLKPYLKDSRKSKVDQYIQFFNMSKIIDVFSKGNGDNKS